MRMKHWERYSAHTQPKRAVSASGFGDMNVETRTIGPSRMNGQPSVQNWAQANLRMGVVCMVIPLLQLGCSTTGAPDAGTSDQAPVSSVRQSIASVQVSTCDSLTFYDPAGWRVSQGSLLLNFASDGDSHPSIMQVGLGGWGRVSSPPVKAPDKVTTTLALAVYVPDVAATIYSQGDIQVFVEIPSRGVWNQPLGQYLLMNAPRGQWKTALFPVTNSWALDQLRLGANDVTFTLQLSLPGGLTAPYAFDNLRFYDSDRGIDANFCCERELCPFMNCAQTLPDGSKLALFGYWNRSAASIMEPAGGGNSLSAGSQGQLEVFRPGTSDHAFATRMSSATTTWALRGLTAVADGAAPPCSPTSCPSSCATGQLCVAGSCMSVCGDGRCAFPENCRSCAQDCGCPGATVCYGTRCAPRLTCGVNVECGVVSRYGQSVDCGGCPTGQSCVANNCR